MNIKVLIVVFAFISMAMLSVAIFPESTVRAAPVISEETEQCLECHRMFTPGIVGDWEQSRHSRMAPADALALDDGERRMSAEDVPAHLKNVVVGCYECHSQNLEAHTDSFDHEGFEINIVVSPNDCNTCHPTEVEQYSDSKKAHAVNILLKNPVFNALVNTTLGVKSVTADGITSELASEHAKGNACFSCHGTVVTVDGMKTVESEYGEMQVPNLINWPNQGVGRINPDGSQGSCAACHTRHEFSIETARKPYTCIQCHLEPDVPAWDVYHESKHGNLLMTSEDKQIWDEVPWKVGEHFRFATCAVCHNAEVANPDGDVIVERTHDFGARLWIRLFSLPYSHPQPKSGATYLIKNDDGLPLPTTFDGKPAFDFLIDMDEQNARKAEMQRVCTTCHSTQWAEGHFNKMDNAIVEADQFVAAATTLMVSAWNDGLEDKTNPFDQGLEKKWVSQWLFYANSVKYGAAMGGADDVSFKNGYWYLSKNLQDMKDMIKLKKMEKAAMEK